MKYAFSFIITLLLVTLGYSYHRYDLLSKSFDKVTGDLVQSQKDLKDEKSAVDYIIKKLNDEQGKTDAFSQTLSEITSTVNSLNKLSKTDKELLQKYSKVYFLNENYMPEALAAVIPEYVSDKNREQRIHAKVLPFLNNMFVDVKNAGYPLFIISGFRSFGEQSSLKASYSVTYGSGANKFSADQGFSEHQLGTALDLTTLDLGNKFEFFEKTGSFTWLTLNAYKYGFILSYPKGNAYYTFEPWHWRFVGVKLATKLHEDNQNFYDLDQRTVDAYLVSIFD